MEHMIYSDEADAAVTRRRVVAQNQRTDPIDSRIQNCE
jgi:hypothetical protein